MSAPEQVSSSISIKEKPGIKGRVHREIWVRQGAIEFADHHILPVGENAIPDIGIDEILQTLGNVITPVYIKDIGVGNGTTPVSKSDSDLIGPSKFWKSVSAVDVVYVRPNLLLTITLAFGDAVFTLNEYATRDNTGKIISRWVDPSPTIKTGSMMMLVQWQYSLPQVP